jgi:hypothetical protein
VTVIDLIRRHREGLCKQGLVSPHLTDYMGLIFSLGPYSKSPAAMCDFTLHNPLTGSLY